jgi:hypothetical protein
MHDNNLHIWGCLRRKADGTHLYVRTDACCEGF